MKDILTSPRIEDMKRKRRAKRLRMTILLCILFIDIIYALGYFSSNRKITINNIVVTGTRIVNAPDVEEVAINDMSGKYLHLFHKSNSFIYPKNKIYLDLVSTFPRIGTLSIYRDNLNTLHIDISERSGTSLYCGAHVPEIESEIGENCYFINNDGYIFDKAPYFSGNVYFKYYTPIGNLDNPMGQQVLPQDLFHNYMRFIDGIELLKFKPTYLVINSEGDSSLYLDHLMTSTSPKILFKTDSDLDDILNNLSLSMNTESFASEINSKYTTLLYIDMRFKNKVLYKFQ